MRQLFDAGERLKHLAWFEGGRSLITVGRYAKQIVLWDVVSGRQRAATEVPNHEPIYFAVHRDGQRLATADLGQPQHRPLTPAQVWTLGPSGWAIEPLPLERGFHGGLAFTPDGSALVGGAACERRVPKQLIGRILWWELGPSRWGQGFDGHAGYVGQVAFTPDGRRFVSYGGDRYVRVWDVASRKEIGSRKVGTVFDPPFGLSPDGRRLVAAVQPMAFLLLDPEGGPKLGKTPRRIDGLECGMTPAGAAAFSPDSSKVALINYGWLYLGPADASGLVRVTDLDAVTHVAFAPDGLTLAAADEKGRVWQIDVD